MTVANCSKCRRIFQRTHGPLCPECHQESISQVSQVYRFVQNNPQMTLDEIAEHCGVPFKELEKMLFEGKLGTAASKVIYHCQRCGQPMAAMMRRGRFCMGCAGKIENEAGLLQMPSDKAKPEQKQRIRKDEDGDDHLRPPLHEVAGGHSSQWALYAAEEGLDEESGLPETDEPAGSPYPDSYGFKRINE
jgi:hypothetical protein